jgi:hypothetical protein
MPEREGEGCGGTGPAAGVVVDCEDEDGCEEPVTTELGRFVRLIRYWKPWQPPLSTWMRSAREGLASRAMISERRWDREAVSQAALLVLPAVCVYRVTVGIVNSPSLPAA